ncbi:MAG: bifunctional riboflavin kinase/FAD synthetase [Erysipelothrix sp.]|jgi:riboflavin kinase/FMN adenylyltransferase|nr:bifunctional riboflavin kinase/FAD synthetase [Erysipelothrix sp.]
MKTLVINENQLPHEIDAFVACIGFFDGIHLGHQALLNQTISLAKEKNIKSGMITFFPHPSSVLQHKQVMYLTPTSLKQNLLDSYGLDYLIIVNFTQEFSKLSGKSFIDDILCRLPLKHLVVGFDFRFGFQGLGNVDLLTQSQTCFEVSVIEQVSDQYNKISSTLIKSIIANGEVELAHQYLTRPHQVRGQVIKGNQRGRTIGFPTANIDVFDDVVIPAKGVYIAKVSIDSSIYQAMVNIGHNPTFNAKYNVSIEANILDFDETIYGKTITIHFLKRIRDEKKFDSIEELIAQLNSDKQETIDYFKTVSGYKLTK